MTHYIKPTIMWIHLCIGIYMIRQILSTTIYKSNINSSFSLWTGKQKAGISKPRLMSVIQDIRAIRTSGMSMSMHILNFPCLLLPLHHGQSGLSIKWLCHDTFLCKNTSRFTDTESFNVHLLCWHSNNFGVDAIKPSTFLTYNPLLFSKISVQTFYGVTGFRVHFHDVLEVYAVTLSPRWGEGTSMENSISIYISWFSERVVSVQSY